MKNIIAAMLIIVGVVSAKAQSCTSVLSGEVVDFHSGEPIVFAVVKTANNDNVVYSDNDGKFTLKNLCDGPLTIQISHVDCEPFEATISIDGDTEHKFLLERHLEELLEVKVVGTDASRKTVTGNQRVLSSEKLEEYSSRSLGTALKQISGVSTLNTGNVIAKPVVQGLHSSRVPVINEGVQLEDQEWGVEHAPNLDLNSAGNITVIKGASALQYSGNAIGGIVLVESDVIPRQDTIYGKTILSSSTNGRGVSLTSSLTKAYKSGWYGEVQGTLKRFGDFSAPDYSLTNTGTAEKDFSVHVGLKLFTAGFDAFYSYYNNEIGILQASHIGNVNDLINAINNRYPSVIEDFSYDMNAPRQEVQHHLARLKFYKRYEALGKWTVQYDFQNNNRLEYDIRVGDDKNKPAVDLNLTTHRISSGFLFDARSHYKLNVGIQGSYQDNFPDPATGVRRLIPDYQKYELGGFVTGNYELGDRWHFEGGFRYDYQHLDAQKYYLKTRWEQLNYDEDFHDLIIREVSAQYLTNPVFQYNYASFTLGSKYDLGKGYHIAANFARSNRPPNPSELFSDGLHHSAAVIELGDLRNKPEKSNKYSLVFNKDEGDLTFSVAPYFNGIDDFLYLEPSGIQLTIRGAFPVWEYHQIDAELYGVDVDLGYTFNNHFSYTGTFAYMHGENADTGESLIDIPAPNMQHSFNYEQESFHHLKIGLAGDWVFKQSEFPDNNFYYQVLKDGEYVNTLVDVSTPPDAYFLLDFKAAATFHPFKKGAMEVGLNVNNLLNTSYRDYLNRLRYYADNLGRNITLQLKFNY